MYYVIINKSYLTYNLKKYIYLFFINLIFLFNSMHYRRWLSSQCPVTSHVQQWSCKYIVTCCIRIQKRLQLLSQRIATYTTRSAIYYWLHAKTTGRSGNNQRLEVCSDGSWQVLFDSVHFFHISRHYCRFVFSTTHYCGVTENIVFTSWMSNWQSWYY